MKKQKVDKNIIDKAKNKSNIFGFRGYTDDIFSILENSGIEVSTPQIWDTNLSNITENNRSSIMRHLGKTIKFMEDNEVVNNAIIQGKLNHPMLKSPFFYILIAYTIFMALSFIFILL
ncbi:MAG: hypothetical protein EAX96_17360 [Candidatus Lokiarchaeota archaeon]|nr:hypothetical protein [Candidatus Lokiarchaeota archaeon]